MSLQTLLFIDFWSLLKLYIKHILNCAYYTNEMSSFTVEKNTVLKNPQSLLFRDNLTLSTKFSTKISVENLISTFSVERDFYGE